MEAQSSESPNSAQALAELCSAYWYPVYAYVRRSGRNREDAEDLTQSFFAGLFNPESFAKLNQGKWRGKLRSFLLTAMKNYMTNDWRKAQAQKRGGGKALLSLDANEAESWFSAEPASAETPETLYERNWAISLLDGAFQRLRAECDQRGKIDAFETLKDILGNPGKTVNFSAIGEKLGTTEGNARVMAHRLRGRLRDLLREVIRDTVGSDAEVEDELAHVRAALTAK